MDSSRLLATLHHACDRNARSCPHCGIRALALTRLRPPLSSCKQKKTAVARSIWLDPCGRAFMHRMLFHRHAGICAASLASRGLICQPSGKEWLTTGAAGATPLRKNRRSTRNVKASKPPGWLTSGRGWRKYSWTPIVRTASCTRDRQRRRLCARRQDRRAHLGASLRHRPEHHHGLLRLGQSRCCGR